MSLARNHFRRAMAAQAAAATEPGHPVDASAYELMLVKLDADKRRLKGIQSVERKIDAKRDLLPDYVPWVEGTLSSGRGGQDLVLMTIMVWRIDVGDYAGALDIAAYALAHDLTLPDNYKRDAATLITEEIADQALRDLASGGVAPWDALIRVEALTNGRDMPDQVRAKLYKAQGLELVRDVGDSTGAAARVKSATALDLLRRARHLNERVGVKKEIERLERVLKNAPDSQAGEPDGATDADMDQVTSPAPATHSDDDEEVLPGNAAVDKEDATAAAPTDSSS